MPRFKLLIEYDGSRYKGWQAQNEVRTLQGSIMDACAIAFDTSQFELYGAGRTDSGVHALGQVAHLDIDFKLTLQAIERKLNQELPTDIHVLSVERAHSNFHARHDAMARSYIYQVCKRRSAFGKSYSWWIREEMDMEKMKAASEVLAGFHDFRNFSDDSADEKSTKVELTSIEIHETGSLILIRLLASHFLHKMARRIVGVMAEVAKGAIDLKEVQSFLNQPSDVPAQLTAPASGLYLEKVFYTTDFKEMIWNDKTPPGFPNWNK